MFNNYCTNVKGIKEIFEKNVISFYFGKILTALMRLGDTVTLLAKGGIHFMFIPSQRAVSVMLHKA